MSFASARVRSRGRHCAPGILSAVLFSLLIFSADIQASIGSRWQFVTPLTRMSSVDGLIWDGTQFVSVGSGGFLLASSDGLSWHALTSGTGSELNAIAINSGGRWLAAGNGGTIVGGLDQRLGTSEVTPISTDLYGIATDGSVFVAVGGSATLIRRGTDGIWLAQTAPANVSGRTLRSVAWHNGMWLAVGDQGTALTSSDGQTWTEQTTNSTADLHAIMWSGAAGLWVAAGSGGNILTSTDGSAWVLSFTDSAAATLRGIWEQSGALFVVGDQSRVLTGAVSVGTVNWTVATTPLTTSLELRTVNSNGSRLVIMGQAGTVLWSDDGGVTWTAQLPDFHAINDVLWNGTQWFGVADGGYFFQSTDGIDWTATKAAVIPTTRDVNGIAWNGSNAYVAVGDLGTTFWSADGSTWTQVNVTCPTSGAFLDPVPTCDAMDVATGATATQFVAVGSLGTIWRSADGGQTWDSRAVDPVSTSVSSATTPITSDHLRPLMRAVAWHGLFVAVGYKGNIWTSADGDTWTVRGSGLTDAPLESVVWDNNHAQWMIVGQGAQLSSTDGLTWTLERALTSSSGNGLAWLNDTTLLSDRVLAVGQSGAIMTSPSGVDWTVIDSEQGNTNFRAVASQSQAAVAVGEGGLIQLSKDFPDLAVSGGATVASIRRDSTVEYAFTVENQAGLDASDVRFSLTLPSDLDFTQAPTTSQGSCTASGRQLVCALSGLTATASAIIDFSVTASKAGTKFVTASVSSDQTDANDLDNTKVSSVTVTADLPSSVSVGNKLSGAGGTGPLALFGLLALLLFRRAPVVSLVKLG
ncbi:MAG: hypothetical protein GC138_09895 [Gammaproteobacteria bacterium]|nr:hypothetical protein [Gammaproteobacteria bacterium]